MKYKESWSPPISDFRRNFLTCDMFFELWPALKSKPLTWFWWIFFNFRNFISFPGCGVKKIAISALDEMFQRQRKSLSFSHLYIYGFASALLLINFFVTPSSPPCIRGVSKHTAAKQENFVLQWYQNIWNQQFNSHIYKLQQKHSIDSLKRWDFEKWPHPREKTKKTLKSLISCYRSNKLEFKLYEARY